MHTSGILYHQHHIKVDNCSNDMDYIFDSGDNQDDPTYIPVPSPQQSIQEDVFEQVEKDFSPHQNSPMLAVVFEPSSLHTQPTTPLPVLHVVRCSPQHQGTAGGYMSLDYFDVGCTSMYCIL
ncbi:hypothetical protein J6590_002412 [Homalodisca vitripennis]|nr:hypothetical protein J6590_002412 [Homalodisca vitripennis]